MALSICENRRKQASLITIDTRTTTKPAIKTTTEHTHSRVARRFAAPTPVPRRRPPAGLPSPPRGAAITSSPIIHHNPPDIPPHTLGYSTTTRRKPSSVQNPPYHMTLDISPGAVKREMGFSAWLLCLHRLLGEPSPSGRKCDRGPKAWSPCRNQPADTNGCEATRAAKATSDASRSICAAAGRAGRPPGRTGQRAGI